MFLKLLKGTQLFILAALIALPLSLLFSSCSGSDDCYYSASRYQKKRKRDGSNLHYRPSSFKHDSPVKKKWIIDKKRKPIIK